MSLSHIKVGRTDTTHTKGQHKLHIAK